MVSSAHMKKERVLGRASGIRLLFKDGTVQTASICREEEPVRSDICIGASLVCRAYTHQSFGLQDPKMR